MIKKQPLPCEICTRPTPIRSTLKSGEYKGKKVCGGCKNIHNVSKKYPKPTKVKEKRKASREGLPEFFATAIEELRLSPFCQNCGGRINISYEPVRNIAHILPKQRYKSVMTEPLNRLFLCAGKDGAGASCHERFDSAPSEMVEMPCFPLAVEKFKKFQEKVVERGKLFFIFANQT